MNFRESRENYLKANLILKQMQGEIRCIDLARVRKTQLFHPPVDKVRNRRKKVEIEACGIEHVISGESLKKIKERLV